MNTIKEAEYSEMTNVEKANKTNHNEKSIYSINNISNIYRNINNTQTSFDKNEINNESVANISSLTNKTQKTDVSNLNNTYNINMTNLNKLFSLPILYKIKNPIELENGYTYYIQISNYILTIKTEYFVNYNESGLTFFKGENSSPIYSGIYNKNIASLNNNNKNSSNLNRKDSINSNNSSLYNNLNFSQTINSSYNKSKEKEEADKNNNKNKVKSNTNTNNQNIVTNNNKLKSNNNNNNIIITTVNNNNLNNKNTPYYISNNESYIHITKNSTMYDAENFTFPCSSKILKIGRDTVSNDIVLETKNVSKIHCSLAFNYTSKKWSLIDGYKDKSSTCGIWLVVKDSVTIESGINEFRYGENKFVINNVNI